MLGALPTQHSTVCEIPSRNSHSQQSSPINIVTAPVMKEVQIVYKAKQFNGSFRSEDVYRQEAGPEVDEAWEALGVDCTYPWGRCSL